MHRQAWNLMLLNVVGGIAVLSSYVHGLSTRFARDGSLWGGVPPEWQGFYTVTMLAAAAGYFPFTYFFLRGVDPERARFAGGMRYRSLFAFYALVLFPSSLWLPLTIQMLKSPNDLLWLGIRLDLFLVAAGSIGLTVAAFTARPRDFSPGVRVAAIAGLLFFCLQTVVLDALVWPALYPR